MMIDEGAPVRREHRSGNVDTIDRIRAIEDDEANPALSSDLHRSLHRRRVGVETRADVLQIEDERIEIIEHRARGREAVPIESVDGNSRIRAVTDGAFLFRAEPVLGY